MKKTNDINLLNLDDKNVLYVIGFLWADGYLNSNRTISLDIKRSDCENTYYNFLKTGDWDYNPYESFLKKTNKYYKMGNISASNDISCHLLIDNDFKNKSHVSPKKLLSSIPDNMTHHFFRGFFDGDGSFSIYNNEKTVNFNVTSTIEQDWSFVIELFMKLNIETYNSWTYKRKSGKSSVVSISNKWDIIKLGEYLYKDSDDLRLERKYKKYQQIKNCDIQKSYPDWTELEIEYLKENYSKMGAEYCSEKMNKSIGSIYCRAFDLNINKSNKKWNDKEDSFIKNNYNTMTAKEIGVCLERSESSVRNRINKIKIF